MTGEVELAFFGGEGKGAESKQNAARPPSLAQCSGSRAHLFALLYDPQRFCPCGRRSRFLLFRRSCREVRFRFLLLREGNGELTSSPHTASFLHTTVPTAFRTSFRLSAAPAPLEGAVVVNAPEQPLAYAAIKDALHAPVYRAVTEKCVHPPSTLLTFGELTLFFLFRPFRYETMTDVQGAVLGLLPKLAGSPQLNEVKEAQDLLVRAKTGTGKTLAFLIPALEGRLRSLETFLETYKQEHPDAVAADVKKALAAYAKASVGALILSPTRELATQIANEATALTTHLPQFGVRLLVGGASKHQQLREWMKSPSNDIVVATPGRCVDLLNSESMIRKPLANARMLILDEADTLLDMGFSDDIATVSSHLPSNDSRQTFLFSATVSKSIREIARKSLKKDHVYIDTVPADEVDTHMHIPQYHTILPSASDQIAHILRLIAHDQLLYARDAAANGGVGAGKTVVFLPTTRMTQLFAEVLISMKNHLPWGRDTTVIEIHSKKNQEQRSRAAESFRRASQGYSVLVTSDVSARGVDYPGVTRVIQVGIPGSRDLYIHRVGRTGRAGKKGRGDLVLLPWESGFISWQLNDIPLKPCTIGETQREVVALAADWDASPATFAPPPVLPAEPRSSRGRNSPRFSTRALTISPTISPRLETLDESLKTSVLPTLDVLAVRETFASLLGYYINKAHELRTTKDVVLSGLKDWSTSGMGLEDEPYVSDEFLRKLGMNDGRTKHRSKPRSFNNRYEDRNEGDMPWQKRGYVGSRGSRSGGDRRDRDEAGKQRGERGFDRFSGERRERSSGGDRFGGERRERSSGGERFGGEKRERRY
jgi:ATP-dependent RNA helicase MSS116